MGETSVKQKFEGKRILIFGSFCSNQRAKVQRTDHEANKSLKIGRLRRTSGRSFSRTRGKRIFKNGPFVSDQTSKLQKKKRLEENESSKIARFWTSGRALNKKTFEGRRTFKNAPCLQHKNARRTTNLRVRGSFIEPVCVTSEQKKTFERRRIFKNGQFLWNQGPKLRWGKTIEGERILKIKSFFSSRWPKFLLKSDWSKTNLLKGAIFSVKKIVRRKTNLEGRVVFFESLGEIPV